jgi:hypothetical protein
MNIKLLKILLKESSSELIDNILDKISRDGQRSLSFDERTYLDQYNKDSVDKGLEDWLLSDNEDTFDLDGNKLLYSEFEDDEDIFYNNEKLIRFISKKLGKKPFTDNANWGGGLVWSLGNSSNYEGRFLYLGDDEFVLLKRTQQGDEYQDVVIRNISSTSDLNNVLLNQL